MSEIKARCRDYSECNPERQFKNRLFDTRTLIFIVLTLLGYREVHAVDCTGRPDWVYYADWTNYSVGIRMKHSGNLYRLTTSAAYGQHSPTSGTGSLYWVNLGACTSASPPSVTTNN